MAEPRSDSYANAWLKLLPQAHLPNLAAQAVARQCAQYADWMTGQNIHPGRRRLAWDLNTSETTVKRAVSELVAHGVVKPIVKGGFSGPKKVAAVYCLSVPEHLATEENLAAFPPPEDVVVVRPKVRSGPRHPELDPSLTASVGHGRPTENPQLSGPRVTPPVGHRRPAQWAIGDPPPSIDPPETHQKDPRADAQAAADADGRTPKQITADGLRAARQALHPNPGQELRP